MQLTKNRASLSALFALVGICLAVTPALAAPVTVPAGQKPSLLVPTLPGDALVGSDRVYPFRESYAFAPDGYPKYHAVLSVTKTRMRQVPMGTAPSEEESAVDIRLYNDSGDRHSFYNVDWNRLIPLPGCLALYDVNKHYVCDLLEAGPGSRASIGEWNWLAIPAAGYMGKTVYASLPYPSYKIIPAGIYYLQVIYHPCAVQPPSEAKYIHYDDYSELFRSNVVPITVVDSSPVKAPKRAQKP